MVIFLEVDQNLITLSHYHGFEGGIICYSGLGTQNYKQKRFHMILMHQRMLWITQYIGEYFICRNAASGNFYAFSMSVSNISGALNFGEQNIWEFYMGACLSVGFKKTFFVL